MEVIEELPLSEADRATGVAIQIYTALIAVPMLQRLTGKKPGKRAMKLIRFHLTDYVGIDGLERHPGLENPRPEGNGTAAAPASVVAEHNHLAPAEVPPENEPPPGIAPTTCHPAASRPFRATSSTDAEHY